MSAAEIVLKLSVLSVALLLSVTSDNAQAVTGLQASTMLHHDDVEEACVQHLHRMDRQK